MGTLVIYHRPMGRLIRSEECRQDGLLTSPGWPWVAGFSPLRATFGRKVVLFEPRIRRLSRSDKSIENAVPNKWRLYLVNRKSLAASGRRRCSRSDPLIGSVAENPTRE